MAKKGSTTRVFQLAKQIGVPSKAIIEKCQAEDVPGVTNHMSAVSMGLAATIREWFNEGGDTGGTAVETAAKVDIAAARAKAKKKSARKKAQPANHEEQPAKAEPTAKPAPAPERTEEPAAAPAAEAPRQRPAAEAPATPPAPAAPDMPPAEHRPAAEAPAETVRPAAEAPTEREQPTATETEAPAKVNVPQRPQVISPAGPQLKQPERTKLAGPKVIRVESPEPVAAPQPRRGGRSDSGPVGRGGPRGGRGVGPEPPGAPPRGRGGGSSRRNKRRSATARPESGRTGRSGGLGSGDQDRGFNWREQDLLERERRLNRSAGFIRAARRDNLKRTSGTGGQKARAAVDTGGKVKVEEPITIKNLSAATGVKVNDIIRQLVRGGDMVANADAVLDTEKAMELMLEYNVELEVVEQKTAEEQIAEQFAEREMIDERPRSPVVTILGHVDHGKTSLLDRIRQTNVAEGEAGGITQATSAFRVPVRLGEGDRMITFIDTPGHEAFTEMRSRGAQVTDIVVLVVAADDGVMPQTVESINHAKAASVPIIVALNKIDKPEATDSNIQRILGQLTEHELNPVEWGGSTEVVRTSAVKDEGLQDLLETLDFQAQLLELTADYGGQAEGTVIEAQMEEGRGAVARLLVQQGQMNQGDFVVVGRAYGRVRDIVSDRGERIKEAGPCTPVAISGIDEVPDAGDKFYVVKSLRDAEAAAQERRQQERERELAKEKVTLDNIFEKLSEQGRKELPLIVKADVQGSLETLKSTLAKIGSEEVVVSIKHAAVGGVNESDVGLAEASGAIIVGFNVTSSGAARRAAEARGVDIRFYDVIYDLTDDVTKAAEGLLEPELKLEVLGHAEVRDVFKVSKVGMIAGCYVTEGTIERHAQIRVTREDIVVEKDRRLEQLKRFKDDVKEVHAGQECGMRIEGYDDIRVGDILECYKTREVRRSL